jgi:hypothetical protein
MRQLVRPHLIQGTLLDQRKILHDVELVIVTKHKSGKKRMKGEAISEIKFAQQSPVPDGGPYILHYVFKGKEHKDPAHVKWGEISIGIIISRIDCRKR